MANLCIFGQISKFFHEKYVEISFFLYIGHDGHGHFGQNKVMGLVMSPITLFCNFFHLERQPFRLFLAAANKEYWHNYNPNLASLRNPALPKADVVAYATAVLLGRNVNFLHFECGGIGSAVFLLAQGLPLHHTVLDGFNLPPLAVH